MSSSIEIPPFHNRPLNTPHWENNSKNNRIIKNRNTTRRSTFSLPRAPDPAAGGTPFLPPRPDSTQITKTKTKTKNVRVSEGLASLHVGRLRKKRHNGEKKKIRATRGILASLRYSENPTATLQSSIHHPWGLAGRCYR